MSKAEEFKKRIQKAYTATVVAEALSGRAFDSRIHMIMFTTGTAMGLAESGLSEEEMREVVGDENLVKAALEFRNGMEQIVKEAGDEYKKLCEDAGGEELPRLALAASGAHPNEAAPITFHDILTTALGAMHTMEILEQLGYIENSDDYQKKVLEQVEHLEQSQSSSTT